MEDMSDSVDMLRKWIDYGGVLNHSLIVLDIRGTRGKNQPVHSNST